MKDKQLEALIRKVQKQQEELSKKKTKHVATEVSEEQVNADEVFSEMKKLPFTS